MPLKTVEYSFPVGNSKSLPLAVPVGSYSSGCKIFFTMKPAIDALTNDSSAVLEKTLTDANIQSNDGVNVNYLLVINPADTVNVAAGKYYADFKLVSADTLTQINYPDPDPDNGQRFQIILTQGVTNRSS